MVFKRSKEQEKKGSEKKKICSFRFEKLHVSFLRLYAESYHFTVSWLKDTSCLIKGLSAGVTYDCRVKAVPQDADKFNASAWSDIYQFEHSGVSTIIESVMDKESKSGYYYNLQGICVGTERPVLPGIYILRKADKAIKILVP